MRDGYTSWIGVDLDGTLAHTTHSDDDTEIGHPIPAMVDRVKLWLSEGKEVRILTARAFDPSEGFMNAVEQWCQDNIGQILDVTCEKDPGLEVLYDDRVRQVERNTGQVIGEEF
jgi:hypothetical protein